MQLVNCSFAAVAVFTALASAAAIPSTHTDHALRQRDGTSSQSQVMGSLSTLLGYQLAGAAENEQQLVTMCNTLNTMGGGKWAKLGLVQANIRGPICNASHVEPNSTYAIVNSIVAHSAMFAVQLVNSFNTTDRLVTLCNDLNLDLIDYFPASGDWVKDAVCQKAGTERAPQPEDNPPKGNPAAVRAARNTASVLYAILIAAGATTDSELSLYCAHAPEYVKRLGAEQLNGTAVESTICSIKEPISVPVAKEMLQAWMTRWFTTVLESVSHVRNWKSWLCNNLDVAGMDAVGLNGVGVLQQVCGDIGAV